MIRPLHNQILIRPLLEDKFSPGSALIMPDNAKKSTVQGADGSAVHFVRAEVVAVGPGRKRLDADLVPDLESFIAQIAHDDGAVPPSYYWAEMIDTASKLLQRIQSDELIPLDVRPGDQILYHPSVQNFDREVDVNGVKHFLIGEHSLLAILEPAA